MRWSIRRWGRRLYRRLYRFSARDAFLSGLSLLLASIVLSLVAPAVNPGLLLVSNLLFGLSLLGLGASVLWYAATSILQ